MICATIKRCSQEVLQWIIQQDEVGEESITDWMLYKLHDLDQNISYKLFNRIQEARVTGADFEFWILTKNFNFKARVQAKRLRQNKDHHSSIAYTNKHGYQIDKLRTDAINNGFRPLYAFYNHEQLNSQCKRQINDEGVYLSCAHTLYRDIIQQPRQTINTQFLIDRSTPFSCWFCCPLCDKIATNGNSLVDFLKEYHGLGDYGNLSDGITKETPSYISSFTELNSNKNDNWTVQTWEKEFHRYIKDIGGLLVIDKRK